MSTPNKPMENIDKKILKIENDISVLMDFRKQMIDDFKHREPAARTWEFINSMKIDMALNSKDHQELKEGLKSIEKKLDDVINDAPTKEGSWEKNIGDASHDRRRDFDHHFFLIPLKE